MAIYKC